MKAAIQRLGCAMLLFSLSHSNQAAAAETESDAIARAVAANRAKDYATSISILRKLVDRGNAAAPAMLGLLYAAGAGVAPDHIAACDLYAAAEQKGDPNGTELLADCYFKGTGRAQDLAQSALLYERAAARGVAIADCALGNQYLRGLGVVKNQAKAVVLCRRSAQRGVADAQTDLGQMYLLGEGVERDLPEAAHWFQRAAQQGQANAALALGKMYWNGDGLERDNLEAAEEIVRQLRLRDVGGIIVIDFIDMVLESNRELVLRRLLECLARDRTKHQVAEVTSLGLVQMTRKRVGAGLLEVFSTPCECCNGPRRDPQLPTSTPTATWRPMCTPAAMLGMAGQRAKGYRRRGHPGLGGRPRPSG